MLFLNATIHQKGFRKSLVFMSLGTLVLSGLFLNKISANSLEQQVRISKLSYKGSACPKGTLSAYLNDTKDTISVNYGNYLLLTGKGRNPKSERKSCQLNFNLLVPRGLSVSIVETRYFGQLQIPEQGSGSLLNTLTFAGKRSSPFRVNFDGPREQAFTLRDPLSSIATVWSSCGTNPKLTLNSSMRIKSPVDEASELTSGFTIKLRYRRCGP